MKPDQPIPSAPAPQVLNSLLNSALDCVRGAGQILLDYFGRVINPRQKENQSSVVCDADLAAERFILDQLQARFPEHNIISEEAGRIWRDSEFTWVVDPLDGTSNFVAGLPWFGVQLGVLRSGKPIVAVMFLPTENRCYSAVLGGGAVRDGQPVNVILEPRLANVLCAFGFDPAPGKRTTAMVELLARISSGVRNTRATNSLIDFCYTVDGRLGACVNMKTKIWDIVPVSLILPEAGGRFTDLNGHDIHFELGPDAANREYAVLGASPTLHAQMLACIHGRS